MSDDLDLFADSFSARVGTTHGFCDCGKEFGADGGGGEGFRFIEFEGRTVIQDCSCWHERAARIMAWLRAHGTEVANFLNADRARRIYAAEAQPVIAPPPDAKETVER